MKPSVGEHDTRLQPVADSWDTYWQGASENDAFTGGGSGHPIIHGFWDELFAQAISDHGSPRLVDIAGGNGAVLGRAVSIAPSGFASLTCVDISESAIDMLRQRIPDVHGIVTDARNIPLESESYEIVTSQFGIEYAGLDAVDEMLRLVAPGGRLALLLHHRGGGIYLQCKASYDALAELQRSSFLPHAIAAFDAGFKAQRGGDRGTYESASKQFAPAIKVVESILKRYGQNVADDTIIKLYKDVRTIHQRMQHYEPGEVIGWLTRMQEEIKAYEGRMASMCEVAIDEVSFSKLHEEVANAGFDIARADALIVPDRNVPLAWALVATKTAG